MTAQTVYLVLIFPAPQYCYQRNPDGPSMATTKTKIDEGYKKLTSNKEMKNVSTRYVESTFMLRASCHHYCTAGVNI